MEGFVEPQQLSLVEAAAPAAAASSSAAINSVADVLPAPLPAPPPPPPQPPAEALIGPDASGYFRNAATGKLMGRRTAEFNKSIAVKCYLHGGKCTLAMATWKVPNADATKEWLMQTPEPEKGASNAIVEELRDQHLVALRRLRDAAMRPANP